MNDYFLLDKLFQNTESVIFSPMDVLLAMLISIILCFVLAYTYKVTHHSTSYSSTYLHTLFIMSIATSVIMIIIGSNIARAFSLVGAMSLIRFRTAVKDPIDTGYLFAAVTIGMACGTGFFWAGILFVLFFSILMLILNYFEFGKKVKQDYILRISYKGQKDTINTIQSHIEEVDMEYSLINRITEFDDGTHTNIYSVSPSKKVEHENIEEQLQKISGVTKVSFYQSDQKSSS
ncbi:uncharacterized protein METZ01_LOCUS431151 [marine metagenome]|uniref:DUF4956 domain-containing protein n=1 Tax=marine metagenome TaxID=408172 RepID=A0A382Y4N2_9ZZZZ